MEGDKGLTKNVSEKDDSDADVWNTAFTARARRRPRNDKSQTIQPKVVPEIKRVRKLRCQPNDINASLCSIPLSAKLYMWGRHRRLRLPASLRMCFPSPRLHFCPPDAKQITPAAYYSKYKTQSEEVHASLFEIEEDSADDTVDVSKEDESKDLDNVPTLELLRSLPRSHAAKLIIEACDAPPATVEAFLSILDSTELMVGLHPDQATEPMIDICLALEIPFAVVPCCIFANIFTHRATCTGAPAIKDFDEYIKYLKGKDSRIKTDTLSCPGRNIVLYFVPESGALLKQL